MSTRAEAVTPPYESNTVIVLSGNTTAQRIKIPDAWRKEYVKIKAVGVNVAVLFGDGSVAADISGTTSVALEVPTLDGDSSDYIADGSGESYDLGQITPTAKDVYLSIDADATAGTIVIRRTSGKVKATP